ncbi:Rossmann-fold NAD(P)-binding domain-containing protein [Mucilaginibacter ginkgonis]|uniref:Uncharacterized protein n=1 Tax=Mucilaginibacter ginkgonis TaxID=2682091 RepID=A0A6I4HUB5_9SPHI|nr:hypothetical protein [Mucilaginibacter ginkgonis]QQL50214.1 hypothetical protein GO620_001815 [Mucilaginibacter ginkgonis]
MTHGKGNKGNLNFLFAIIKNGIPYPLGAFNNKRSFLSVSNLCELIHRKDIFTGIYVADDDPLATTEVVKIISSALKRRARIWLLTQNITVSFAEIGKLFHRPLATKCLKKIITDFVVSNEKIKAVLHKDFPITSRQEIFETIESFIEYPQIKKADG